MSLDYAIFKAINDLAGNSIMDHGAVLITNFGIYLIGLIGLFFCRKKTVGNAVVAVTVVFILDFVFKLFYFRERPFALHDVNLLVDHIPSASFPSRHSSLSFAAAYSFFLDNKKIGIITLSLAGLVALSRVYVGVHYVSDIIVGAVFGMTGAYAVSFILHKR